jgi:hypothetical protein
VSLLQLNDCASRRSFLGKEECLERLSPVAATPYDEQLCKSRRFAVQLWFLPYKPIFKCVGRAAYTISQSQL